MCSNIKFRCQDIPCDDKQRQSQRCQSQRDPGSRKNFEIAINYGYIDPCDIQPSDNALKESEECDDDITNTIDARRNFSL